MNDSYKIIGADGREYGPATLEELQEWAREGRVGRQTKVWSGGEQRWLEAAALPELQEEVARMPDINPAGAPAVFVQRPAGFWIRFVAWFVDHLLIGSAVLAIVGFPEIPADSAPDFQRAVEWADASQPWVLAFSAVYFILTIWRWGATPGKFLVGVRVVRVDDAPAGFKEAALRFVVSLLSQFFFIGYLFILFREDKRALHDLVAGTKVIHIR